MKNAFSWRTVPQRLKNPGVREALRLSRQDALSPTEAEVMSKRQLYKIDQKNILLAAQLEGRALGEALGEARGEVRGEARGEARARMVTAKNLLQMGLPPEQVAHATELALDEVLALAGPGDVPSKRKKTAK